LIHCLDRPRLPVCLSIYQCIYLHNIVWREEVAIMKTTWKEIAPVPTSQEFIDIVLSRTQRKLPTQIRSGFKISRIRGEQQWTTATGMY
jgi:hypothetical protein